MASTIPTEGSTESAPTRSRAQVTDELVSAIKAREAAKNAQERKPLRRIVMVLESELLMAPSQPVHAGKGVVDIEGVRAYLEAHPDESLSSEALASVTGHEPTAAVKARITHWARREAATEVVQEGRPGRFTYRIAA